MDAVEPSSPRPAALVAVVSWNTRELLARGLGALRADTEAGRAEVWVLDNASSDGSAAMVAERFPWVHLLALEANLGFGAAVNRIARARCGPGAPDWLAIANADTAVEPGALAALLTAGSADPRAGILAPALVREDGSLEHSVHPFPGPIAAVAVNLGLGRLSPALARRLTLDGRWDPARTRRVDWAHGAFLLVRRRAFDAVGGFDPDQFLYAEDLDLAWRLARHGHPTRYVPDARVTHTGSAAIRQLYGDERDLRAQRAAYAWLRRRRGATIMRLCALGNTMGAGARALGTSLLALGADEPARHHAWQMRRHTRLHLDGLLASRRELDAHR